jgi:hypothetical protein
MSLLKKSRNRLLMRAAQKRAHDFATSYRAVTVRERSAAFFSKLKNAYSTVLIVLQAWALVRNLRGLRRKRHTIQRGAKISVTEFCNLLRVHSIRARRVAEL